MSTIAVEVMPHPLAQMLLAFAVAPCSPAHAVLVQLLAPAWPAYGKQPQRGSHCLKLRMPPRVVLL